MKLTLGRRGDYAVRAGLDLARFAQIGLRKRREIAEEMAIPEQFLPRILADLVRAGLVASVAGPAGGYRLARPAATISVLEVIDAADDSPGVTECVLRGGPCRWEEACALHEHWSAAKEALRERLARTTLAELAEADARLGG